MTGLGFIIQWNNNQWQYHDEDFKKNDMPFIDDRPRTVVSV